MKILILGASGMAGHTISLYLSEKGHDITALSTTKFPYCKNVICDVFDIPKLTKIIGTEQWDGIINCIGILNQTAEQYKDKATFLNSYIPHFLATTIEYTPTKLIHMSTDCVFRGNTGPYSEDSFPDGITFYDRSKSLGEIFDSKNLTFRNSIIGPDMKENGIGLFNWFMKQKGPVRGYTNAIWTGVTTLTLAKAMEQALTSNLSGVYNLVNNQSISKYELLNLFNKYFKDGKIEIIPYHEFKLDKTLICARNDFDFVVPCYEDMIKDMHKWILDHKYLYPHYNI